MGLEPFHRDPFSSAPCSRRASRAEAGHSPTQPALLHICYEHLNKKLGEDKMDNKSLKLKYKKTLNVSYRGEEHSDSWEFVQHVAEAAGEAVTEGSTSTHERSLQYLQTTWNVVTRLHNEY